ncbi:MAG TPA: hypothetical protein PLK31_24515 [Chloroflexota bacterium]|nr:hypothetical protein [Chloroflexota bacterium]
MKEVRWLGSYQQKACNLPLQRTFAAGDLSPDAIPQMPAANCYYLS